MPDFSAGTVYVQVLPSLDGWRKAVKDQLRGFGDLNAHINVQPHIDKAALEKELAGVKFNLTPTIETSSSQAKKEADKAAGAFADAFKSRVAAALKSLPDAEIRADATEADRVIADVRAKLLLLSKAKIGIDISAEDALIGIEYLQQRLAAIDGENVTVDAHFNAKAATAELEAFHRQVIEAGRRDGGAFSDAFTAAVKAALAKLPDVRLHGDSSDVDRSLAKIRTELAELADKRIGIDIDEREALAKMDALRIRLAALDKQGATLRVRFDAGQATADLDRLRAQVTATGAEADRRIAEVRLALSGLAGQRVGIDIEDEDAKRKLDALKSTLVELSAATASVHIRAEVAKALADLELVRVVMSEVDGEEATVTVKADDHGSIDLLSTRMARLVAAVVAGSGAIGGLAVAFIALAAGAVVGAAGLGAVAIGATAIGSAMKAQTAASQQAGQTAAQEAQQRLSAANQVLSAQESILNAQDALKAASAGVGEAQRSASITVRQALEGETRAEERLQGAQLSALRAQEELTAARQDAARSIEDLQNKVTDDALSQREAVLSLEDAQAKLAAIQADPGATDRQRADAQLNFEQAQQHLAEISLSYKRSQADAQAAAKAGVNGSKQVVSAQDNIANSQRELAAAVAASAEASRKTDEAKVAGAKQVADAQIQVVHAQRGLEQSQRSLTQAQSASAVQAQHQGEAHQKFADALDKLSPASLRLVSYLRSQSGEWQSLSKASQGFAPGVQKGLQELQPSFGAINQNMATLSTSAGDFFHVIGKGLAGARPFFDTIAASSQTLFPRFGETVNRAASAVGQLTLDMLPVAPAALDTVDAFSELIKTWSPFIAQASGPLLDSLQSVIHNLDFLGPLLVAIAKPAGDLTNILVSGLRDAFSHLTPEIGPLLQSLVDMVGAIAPLIGSAGELAAVIAQDATPVIKAATAVIAPLVSVLGDLVHLFALLPAPITGAVVAFAALSFAGGGIEKLMTKVGIAITGLGGKMGDTALKVGVGTAAAGKFASAGERVGTAVSKMGSAIPIVGAALIGIGELFAAQAEDAQRAREAIEKWGAALLAGGSQADTAAGFLRGLRRAADDAAAKGGEVGEKMASSLRHTADEAEASAKRQEDAMSAVELSQLRVAQAQRDYDQAVRDFGPTSAIAIEAHGRLVGAVDNVKRAQHDAAEATKTHTQRLQDQQDQILAMADAGVAKDRAGLQLQRAGQRIDTTKTAQARAEKEAQQAQKNLADAVRVHGKNSDEATQAQAAYVDALDRADSAAIDTKEAVLDLTSAQSRYVATSADAAAATAAAGGTWDTEAARIKGNNDALIDLLRTQGDQLPPSVLSMIAHLDEADKKFYGLTTTVDATGQTILNLPGGPNQPPVEIKFHDNIPAINDNIDTLQGKLSGLASFVHGLLEYKPADPAGLAVLLGLVPPGSAAAKAPTSAIPGTLGGLLGRASGGPVPGSGTGDTVPALLTPGEFVLSRPAVQHLGMTNVAAMHARARRGFAHGGAVTPARFADGGTVSPAPATADPTSWLVALAAVFDDITTATSPLSVALHQQLVPALDATFTASAHLSAGSTQDWTAITAAVAGSVSTITGSYLATLRAELALVELAVARTATTFAVQWAAIRGYAADPVRFALAGPFNSLIAAWNLIDTTFAVGKPLAPLVIPFAAGGAVTGGEHGKDSVLAYLMPGEYVLPVSMVDQIGVGNLEAARRSTLAGGGPEGLIPGFEAGGAVTKALLFATSQVGKPYLWGGVGPDGYDCTGLLSAVANVALGLSPYSRRFSTADFAPDRGAGGFLPGRDSTFVIGVSDAHAAGTLAGHNIESTTKNGISGVRVDGDASGALDRQFTKGQFFLPDLGGVFVPGPTGGAPFNMAALLGDTFAATRDAIARLGSSFGANTLAAGASAEMTQMVDAILAWTAANLTAGVPTGAGGTGPVADQIRGVAARFGWGDGAEWNALSTLIDHESGWNPVAQNPTSTAYGIFQFLDSTWAGTGIGKTDNPTLQAEAGLRYIQGRYGDPVGAWDFWSGHHWYDDGGYLPPGLSLAYNGTSRPEPVLTPPQWQAMAGHSSASGGAFTGSLYLDSGEFLGAVRGEIARADDATGRAVARRSRI